MKGFIDNIKSRLPAHSSLCACFMVLLLMILLSSRGAFIQKQDLLSLLIGLGVLVFAGTRGRQNQTAIPPPEKTDGRAPTILCCLLVYLSSGIGANSWFYFPGWSLVSESFPDSGMVRSLIATAGLLWLFKRFPFLIQTKYFAGLAGIFVICHLFALGRETGFEPLYRVDHSSFFYRFSTFMDAFPNPAFYDPNWNGGKPVPYLVASGVWVLALPWFPFLKWMPLEALYTPLLAVTFMILVPLSGYAATRTFEGSKRAALLTAILFMVPGQRYFTHILHYGTLPSIFSLSLFPLILSLFWKLFHREHLKPLALTSLALILVSGLALCWPGALLCGLPLVLALLAIFPLWTPRRLLWIIISAGVLLFLLTPMAVVPIKYSPINAFLEPQAGKPFLDHWFNGAQLLADLTQGIHPLIVVFGITHFFLDPNRLRGRMIGIFILISGLLAGWGEEISPLLQWERQIIPAAMVGAVAAGLGIDRLLMQVQPSLSRTKKGLLPSLYTVAAAWIVSLILLGGYEGYTLYANRGQMDFQTMPRHTRELLEWLKAEVPEEGRLLIAGRAVHGYGGAKVAAMPLFIDREMISSDYYGFSPKLVEYQCPPRRVLDEGPDGVFRYLNIYNVTQVMTYHDSWKAAFDRHPEYYRPRYENGIVQVYDVIRENSMLDGARGSVQAGMNQLQIALAENTEAFVLKYNWSDDWKITPPAEIYPVEREFGITLIGIRPQGLRNLELEHRN